MSTDKKTEHSEKALARFRLAELHMAVCGVPRKDFAHYLGDSDTSAVFECKGTLYGGTVAFKVAQASANMFNDAGRRVKDGRCANQHAVDKMTYQDRMNLAERHFDTLNMTYTRLNTCADATMFEYIMSLTLYSSEPDRIQRYLDWAVRIGVRWNFAGVLTPMLARGTPTVKACILRSEYRCEEIDKLMDDVCCSWNVPCDWAGSLRSTLWAYADFIESHVMPLCNNRGRRRIRRVARLLRGQAS